MTRNFFRRRCFWFDHHFNNTILASRLFILSLGWFLCLWTNICVIHFFDAGYFPCRDDTQSGSQTIKQGANEASACRNLINRHSQHFTKALERIEDRKWKNFCDDGKEWNSFNPFVFRRLCFLTRSNKLPWIELCLCAIFACGWKPKPYKRLLKVLSSGRVKYFLNVNVYLSWWGSHFYNLTKVKIACRVNPCFSVFLLRMF